MRNAIIALVALLLLANTASALTDKGFLATCLSVSTTSTGPTTLRGSDIQNMDVAHTPSLPSGFTSERYVYVRAKDAMEASKIASKVAGYGIKNLRGRVWTSDSCIKSGDFKVDLTKEVITGSEGANDSHSTSQGSAISMGTRRGVYASSQTSTSGASSQTTATAVFVPYAFSLEVRAKDGQMDVLPVIDVPLGGSASTATNQSASDRISSSRTYGNNRGSSRYHHSSNSTSSTWRSPQIQQAMMQRRLSNETIPDVAALVVDAITNAAMNGLLDGVITTSCTASVPQEQNITTSLR